METPNTSEFAHLGKSVTIKGDLSGSEDLYVDGIVEGTIELHENNLVIGPNGQVRASVSAKVVTVQGRLEGNVRATEKTELRGSAVALGDIVTQRIAIEDGAYFKGKIDIQKETEKSASTARPETTTGGKNALSAAGTAASSATASGAGMARPAGNTSVTKK